MCKKTSIVLLALISICLVQAQEQQTPKMEIGIHGGPGASIFFNERPLQNPRNPHRPVYNGGMLGVSYQYNFTKLVALHIETNYERKGDIWYSTGGWDSPNSFRESYAFDRTSYITVPVTARLSFGKTIKFFVNGGLYAGLQISSKRVVSDTRYTPVIDVAITDKTTVTDITRDVRIMDGGVVTGLGLFLPVGKRAAFTLEARNNVGFANLNANTGLYQNKFYNNSTVVLLGLSFALDGHYKVRADKAVKEQPAEKEMKY